MEDAARDSHPEKEVIRTEPDWLQGRGEETALLLFLSGNFPDRHLEDK